MNVRTLAIVALVLLCGCEPPTVSTSAKSGPPPPPPAGVQVVGEAASPEPPPTAITPEEQPVDRAFEGDFPTQPVVAPETTVSPGTTQPAAARQPLIRLSAGVALPQLLPEGTQIGVSVDYKVTGQLNSSARYVLVVDSSAGQVTVPIELSPQGGTIQGFLAATVRPEHKPFNARIDEVVPGSRSGVKVSNTAALATSY